MNDAPSYNVTAVIDQSPISRKQWAVLGISLATALFDGYDTQGIGYVAPAMAHDLGLAPGALGPVFSASFFGLTIGAVVFGMLADKIGRKQAIIWPMAVFGVFSLLTPLGRSVESLVILRALAGFGLGGTLPNVTAYVLEYAPQRRRALLVNSTGAFFAVGSISGGLLANWLIPTVGWQSTFYIGGGVPLLFIIVVALWMPESVRYLLLSGKSMARAAAIMMRIVPDRNFTTATQFTLEPPVEGITVKHLFTEGRALPTTLLWIAFVMNLFVLTYLISWMPTLLKQAGQPLSIAIIATIWYSIGGIVGGLSMGFIADRIGSLPKVLVVGYLGAAVFITVVAFSTQNTAILIPAVFLTGVSIQGGQPCLNTIAATFYPTAIRATGIGWALGVGRVGAFIGPLIGGLLVMAQFGVPAVILANVVPAVIGAAAVVLFQSRHRAKPVAVASPRASAA
jgi:AAHS family 4-hydroxybenzoate transporter-like MFS transporter